jgi:thioesterase domain-containing protein
MQQGQQQEQGCLVELKKGCGNRCLFFIHDGDGEVVPYLNLARSAPPEVNVYGVVPRRSPALPTVHSSIPEMARHYAREIRSRQPHGPYYLGGLCAGGVIAFETSRILEEQGESIAGLFLIEAANPRSPERSAVLTRRWRRISDLWSDQSSRSMGDRVGITIERLKRMVRYELERAAKDAGARARLWLVDRGRRPGAIWPAVGAPTVRETYRAAREAYRPSPLREAGAVLFRSTCTDGPEPAMRTLYSDGDFGWRALIPGELEVIDVAAGHSAMLTDEHVAPLVERIQLAFNQLAHDPFQPAN